MELVVLLGKTLVELWKLDFHIVLAILLLIPNDLEDFVLELLLTVHAELFQLAEHGLHQGCQGPHVLLRHVFASVDVFVHVAEVLPEVIDASEASHDLLLLSLVHIYGHFLGVTYRLVAFGTLFGHLAGKLLRDALLAEWLVFEHHDRLREMVLAQVHRDVARVHWSA